MAALMLLKSVLLLVGIYCLGVSWTSPNPASSEEESVYNQDSRTKKHIQPKGTMLAARRVMCYVIALVEVGIILLSFQSSSFAIPKIFHPSYSFNVHKLSLSPEFLVGNLCLCTGTLIRALSYRQMGHLYTFSLSIKKKHRLITTGPYAIVRHPGYSGGCLVHLGTTLAHLSRGSWLAESGVWDSPVGRIVAFVHVAYGVYFCLFLIARVPREDTVLEQEFKEEWVAWSKRTPYRLIPLIY